MKSDVERQQKRRDKLYNAGFKPMQIWVKRKETKQKKITMVEFSKEIKKLTNGWDKENLSNLLNLLLKIVKSRKEEVKFKKT